MPYKDPEKQREYNRLYREKNRDTLLEKKREWFKEWYEKNREKKLATNKKWRDNNKEKMKEYDRIWCEENKEKVNEYRKRAREKAETLKITRMTEICGGELKCQWDGCNVTDHRLLSVCHVNGRLPEEYNETSYVHRGKTIKKSYKGVEKVSKEIFRYHLENDNYRVYCMNHAQIFEYGVLEDRLKQAEGTPSKYRIKRTIKRLQILGGKCVKCGETDLNFLCADHVHNDGKNHPTLRSMTWDLFNRLVKHEKLQVLCMNCNLLKRFEEEQIILV